VPDRVRVCTRHVARARHSRVSLPNCPWEQSFEEKNLGLSETSLTCRDKSCIRECMRGYKLKCEFTESRKSTNRLCRCAIARPHACRLCAANGTVAPPLLDGRKSVASIARVNLCASIGGSGIARSANRLRRCAIARPHARSLCAATGTVAPPLLDGRKSVSSSAHANMRATTDGAEIPRSGNSQPRRAIGLGYSPRPSTRSRTHRRPRFIDGRKSPCPPACAITKLVFSENDCRQCDIPGPLESPALNCTRSRSFNEIENCVFPTDSPLSEGGPVNPGSLVLQVSCVLPGP
jgi:hypothetical protein